MTNQELNKLVKHFKELCLEDINGITSSDARRTVTQWLYDIGWEHDAKAFEKRIIEYQLSPGFLKAEREYQDNNDWRK